jgi:hypothetical protein
MRSILRAIIFAAVFSSSCISFELSDSFFPDDHQLIPLLEDLSPPHNTIDILHPPIFSTTDEWDLYLQDDSIDLDFQFIASSCDVNTEVTDLFSPIAKQKQKPKPKPKSKSKSKKKSKLRARGHHDTRDGGKTCVAPSGEVPAENGDPQSQEDDIDDINQWVADTDPEFPIPVFGDVVPETGMAPDICEKYSLYTLFPVCDSGNPLDHKPSLVYQSPFHTMYKLDRCMICMLSFLVSLPPFTFHLLACNTSPPLFIFFFFQLFRTFPFSSFFKTSTN